MVPALLATAFLPAFGHDMPGHATDVYLPTYEGFRQDADPMTRSSEPFPAVEGETRLRDVRQLTFGGQNAEAYWSANGREITYQTLQPGWPDEQIVTMAADGSGKTLRSTGKGRCTCSYYTPDGKALYFSSTHEKNEGAQVKADMSKGYVWMVNPQFSLYRRDLKTDALTKVVDANAYVAETTIAPNGAYMTWTSDKDGDLEIYRSRLDGSDVRRLTNAPGYDGGPFVSWDGRKIVYRRDADSSPAAIEAYQTLLKEHLVRPSKLEIWIMDADGKNARQVTNLGCASFAPFLSPDGRKIVFSSNYGDPKGREFDLFTIGVDGRNLERITKSPEFDGFPMWSRDGKKLLFASNRGAKVRGETNVFVADWVK